MTEKLLSKPPFRYLHDIFLATMAAAEFGNGLFTEEEMDSKANHEKDAKISILTKMITLTEMIVGEKIDVKPTKIVAGLEPERTNYFLQQLFRAATCGVDSTPYVRQIMGGGGDDDAEAEEEARRQAEAQAAEDEKAKRKAQEQKKKQAEEKKKQEEMQRKRQEEEEDRRRKEAEAQARREQEEAKAR
jgi:TRAF3-interacting protein 1